MDHLHSLVGFAIVTACAGCAGKMRLDGDDGGAPRTDAHLSGAPDAQLAHDAGASSDAARLDAAAVSIEDGGEAIVAHSLEYADVAAAVAAASDCQTVQLPEGTVTWSSALMLDRGVTLRGAGIDHTVIVNARSIDVSTLTGAPLVQIVASASSRCPTRITALTLDGNRMGGAIDCSGEIFAPLRIDHCKVMQSRREGVLVQRLVAGVVDHCTFVNNYLQIGDYPTADMNASWQMPLTLGTTQAFVIEDNEFSLHDTGSWDPWGSKFWSGFENGLGARVVFRHNHWVNDDATLAISPIFDAHGNQAVVDRATNTGMHRATRSLEMYSNTFENQVPASYTRYCRMTYLRGGVLILYDNSFTGGGLDTGFAVNEEDGSSRFRLLTSYPGYDQHWLWAWNNTSNATPIASWYSALPGDDATFLRTGTNVFWAEPSATNHGEPVASSPITGYTPLVYPHPLVTAGGG